MAEDQTHALAAAVLAHEWVPGYALSAHRAHHFHGACAVCAGDVTKIVEVVTAAGGPGGALSIPTTPGRVAYLVEALPYDWPHDGCSYEVGTGTPAEVANELRRVADDIEKYTSTPAAREVAHA